jgi:hypothetical protein
MKRHATPDTLDAIDVSENRASTVTWNIGSSTYQRFVYRCGSSGVFLGVVAISNLADISRNDGINPFNAAGHVMTNGSRYTGENFLRVRVRTTAGTLQTNRVTPLNLEDDEPVATLQCKKFHTHTTNSEPLEGLNGITTVFHPVNSNAIGLHGVVGFHQVFFVVRLDKGESLSVHRDDYPDIDCRVQLFRLSDTTFQTGRAEI